MPLTYSLEKPQSHSASRLLSSRQSSCTLAKHLGGAGLVKADFGVVQANNFEQIECAHARDLRRGAGLVKRHVHKALRGQVINLV